MQDRQAKRPIWAIRVLGISAVIIGCTIHSANATANTDPTPARAQVDGTPVQVMAEHGCSADVELIDSTGVVVSRNGAPTYLAGTKAAGDAFTNRASVHIYAFCK